ncbi:MAG: hypothetical protein H0X01_06455 [Nitrospira sp.]|nr:hypothetical protein [Nitrospira sp.]
MIVTVTRTRNVEETAAVELDFMSDAGGITVISYLRSGKVMTFVDGVWSQRTEINIGSEGLVVTAGDSPYVISMEAIEGACFSGAFFARSFLGINAMKVILRHAEGHVLSRSIDGFALAAAIGVVVSSSTNHDALERMMKGQLWNLKTLDYQQDRR